MSSKIVRYTEQFLSIQGEGRYTGKLSMFFRFFGCNLSCAGFFQADPTDQTTYVDPLDGIDPKAITKLEDVPVFKFGCDTGYSVSAKFKHLAKSEPTDSVAIKMCSEVPYGWKHFNTGSDVHLVFTGGEPLLWQTEMLDIVESMVDMGNFPKFITVETNGTKVLSQYNRERIVNLRQQHGIEWQWSVSPKLFSVSGERGVVNHDAIDSYYSASNVGYLKFVVNNTDVCWEELSQVLQQQPDHHTWEIYIMPCGASIEQQNDVNYLSAIATRAIREGYHVSGRLHVNIFGNATST